MYHSQVYVERHCPFLAKSFSFGYLPQTHEHVAFPMGLYEYIHFKKIPTSLWNVPWTLNHLFMKGILSYFDFWDIWGMVLGSVGIFLDACYIISYHVALYHTIKCSLYHIILLYYSTLLLHFILLCCTTLHYISYYTYTLHVYMYTIYTFRYL